ncbi:uncharacterized protein LOC142589056 isoform X3 [Dermacentor variabilis]|uniref:uncharacterized protein LOC142589056 isoform X3 n=1 Tax=Dermacentor variabilis TaxID=34621 RepID=UPI003F5B5EBD
MLITLVLAYKFLNLTDLQNVLKANQVIWIRHRNYDQHIGRQHYCEYFEIAGPKPPKYVTVQHYKVGRTWRRIFREAYATAPEKPYRGPTWVLKKFIFRDYAYELIFWEPTEHCAIMTIGRKKAS